MEGIKLNDQYTIVASPLTWVLMQYKGAPSFATKGIAFQPELADILTSAVSREIRVPADVKELSEKVDKLNARIEELFPKNFRVKDVLQDLAVAEHTMYMYHPKSDSLFIIKKGDLLPTDPDFELCDELEEDDWKDRKKEAEKDQKDNPLSFLEEGEVDSDEDDVLKGLL